MALKNANEQMLASFLVPEYHLMYYLLKLESFMDS